MCNSENIRIMTLLRQIRTIKFHFPVSYKVDIFLLQFWYQFVSYNLFTLPPNYFSTSIHAYVYSPLFCKHSLLCSFYHLFSPDIFLLVFINIINILLSARHLAKYCIYMTTRHHLTCKVAIYETKCSLK